MFDRGGIQRGEVVVPNRANRNESKYQIMLCLCVAERTCFMIVLFYKSRMGSNQLLWLLLAAEFWHHLASGRAASGLGWVEQVPPRSHL